MPSTAFSYSAINTYNQCPYKYKKLYIEYTGWEKSENLEFGKFIHKILQLYQKRLVEIQKKKDTQWIVENYDKIYNQFLANYDKKYIDKGKEIMNFAMNIDFDPKRAISIEHHFSARLNQDVFINGVFDRAERIDPKTFLITDWKTGEPKNLEKMEEDLQYIIYSFAAQKNYPLYEKINLRWVYLESGQVYDLDAYDFEKSKTIIEENVNKILNDKDIFKEKEYPTSTKKLCLWCSFYKDQSCPDYEKIKKEFEK